MISTPPLHLFSCLRSRPTPPHLKVKVDNFFHLKILRVDIGSDFPEFPPQLTLCDPLSEFSRPLDRRLYLYSPRWDAERMATELYAHAVEVLSKPA